MNRAKLIFSATMGLGVAIAIGCSSSSSQPPADFAGTGSETSTRVIDSGGDTQNLGANCNPLLNELCPQGQTCVSPVCAAPVPRSAPARARSR